MAGRGVSRLMGVSVLGGTLCSLRAAGMEQRGSGAQLGGCPTGAARMSTRPARPTCTRTKDQVPQDHVPSALQLHDFMVLA